MQYKTYLFDFDYTLANSEKGIVMCFEKLLAEDNYPTKTKKEIKHTIGLAMPKAISILTGETDTNVLRRLQKQYSVFSDTCMTENTHLYETTVPILKKLKASGCQTGIVSNKTRRRILQTLHKENIANLIDIIIGTENAQKPKPAPEPIWQALAALHADKPHSVYIGDSITDAKTAKAAGVAFAAVLTGETGYAAFVNYPHIKIMQSLQQLC